MGDIITININIAAIVAQASHGRDRFSAIGKGHKDSSECEAQNPARMLESG